MARKGAISIEAASAKAAVRSKKTCTRLVKECDSNRQLLDTAKSAVTVLHEELEVVTAKGSDLASENARLQKRFDTSSKTHVETERELAKNPGETRDDLGKKIQECDALRARVGELGKEFETLLDAPEADEKEIEGLKLQVTSDAKSIARSVTLVKDHFLNSIRMAAANKAFWRGLNDERGNTPEAVSSAE